ncbi:unnamed protein product [Vitrella brassicaformis CCMP3155]|uniref:Uncharacterized protein n=2 Tax=Vitrella brassicaformis TaxID=1169539 RepID=A0A0G4FZV1_VITBC|nr:unnamed protein product [Vitrella brassicaformis CCMP3155]|eukprot:CEM20620.1 unnamed protein product [Vitrella brassicaformis CCMP3155]
MTMSPRHSALLSTTRKTTNEATAAFASRHRPEEVNKFLEQCGWFALLTRLAQIERRISDLERDDGRLRTSKQQDEDIFSRMERQKELIEDAKGLLNRKTVEYREEMTELHRQEMQRDLKEIASLPDDVISRNVKRALKKFKSNMRTRRVSLDIANKKINEWSLPQLIKEVKESRKRARSIASMTLRQSLMSESSPGHRPTIAGRKATNPKPSAPLIEAPVALAVGDEGTPSRSPQPPSSSASGPHPPLSPRSQRPSVTPR